VIAFVTERSSGGGAPGSCSWAIASARRDREIVSSARLILVISNESVISLRIRQTLARELRVS
jgi:hypothetical protein